MWPFILFLQELCIYVFILYVFMYLFMGRHGVDNVQGFCSFAGWVLVIFSGGRVGLS